MRDQVVRARVALCIALERTGRERADWLRRVQGELEAALGTDPCICRHTRYNLRINRCERCGGVVDLEARRKEPQDLKPCDLCGWTQQLGETHDVVHLRATQEDP